jgi:uncharacterized SAM-binding protein YcdF (DUF218 family)
MKQFFSPLTEPLGAIWLLMALGVAWLLVRRQWRSALWLGIPTALLFLLGSTSIAEGLVAVEERRWEGKTEKLKTEMLKGPTLTQQTADAVVALGGGDRVSRHDILGLALSDGGSRLLTAIEMVRSGRAKTLVLGGSWPLPGNPALPSMTMVQEWVARWGLVSGAITNLGICITTRDEAVAFKQLKESQGWRKVILVTSALHLRRSEALFRKLGIEVIPVAADFQVWGVPQDSPFSPFPRQHRLFLLALYMHEKIGWWVYRARGWV